MSVGLVRDCFQEFHVRLWPRFWLRPLLPGSFGMGWDRTKGETSCWSVSGSSGVGVYVVLDGVFRGCGVSVHTDLSVMGIAVGC